MSFSLLLSLSIIASIILFSLFYIKKKKNKIVKEYISKSEKNKIKNKPLMIIGPSGVGKDTLISMLINKYPKYFIKCVSCTTRKPRKNEKDGINYYFISKQEFKELERNGQIIGKFKKYDILYGTSKEILNNTLTNDKIVYFDYNIETAINTFNENTIEFNYIAFLPPSIEELENRLIKRGTENKDDIKKRMDYEKVEVELINKSKFLNYIIINNDLENAFNEFELCVKQLYRDLFI